MTGRRSSFVIYLAAILSESSIASAQESSEPLSVHYAAASSCPPADEFFAAVQARSSRVRRAADEASARTVHVKLYRKRDTFVGELAIQDRGRASRVRQVSGATCDEVASAVALIAAVSIDPTAIAGSPPGPESPTSATDVPDVSAAPSPAETPSMPKATRTLAQPIRDAPSSPPHKSTSPKASAWVVAADGSALHLGASPPAFRGHVGLRYDTRIGTSLGFGGALAQGQVESALARARLAWTTAVAEVCPFRLRFADHGLILPCAPVEIGTLSVAASGIENASTHTRLWASAGVHARIEWTLLTYVVLSAHAGGVVPLIRDTYYVRPTDDVFRAPAIMAIAGGGVGVRFP